MRRRELCYTIRDREDGIVLGQFLKAKGFSHRLAVRIKAGRGLAVDGMPAHAGYRLKAGETVEVALPEEEDSGNIVPVKLPLSIVYEDEDILVINKDAGVPIHPSQGHYDNTLANAVSWYFREKGEAFTYRVINRLDRDTTGLLILARHMLSACILSEQMAGRRIRREYRAIVLGHTPEEGTVDSPIARAEGSTIERRVDPEAGERAVTHYRTLLYNEKKDLSLVSLSLETGRTHQIRVHMRSIGHPLPGDFLYCPDYRYIGRQPLHSYLLRFEHPISGKEMEFTAGLPEDMERLLPPGT